MPILNVEDKNFKEKVLEAENQFCVIFGQNGAAMQTNFSYII